MTRQSSIHRHRSGIARGAAFLALLLAAAFGCDIDKTFDNSQNTAPFVSKVGSLISVVGNNLELRVNVGAALGANAFIEFNDANSKDLLQVTVGTPVSATGGLNTTNDGLTITAEGSSVSKQFTDNPIRIDITGALARAGSETVLFTVTDNVNTARQITLTIISIEPVDNPVLSFGINTTTSSPTVTEIAATPNTRNYTVSVAFGGTLNVNFSGDGDVTNPINGTLQVDPSFNDNAFYPGTYDLGTLGGANNFNLTFNGANLGAGGTSHSFNISIRNFTFNLASAGLPQPPAGSTTPGQFKLIITLNQTAVVPATQNVTLLVTVQPPPPTPDVLLIGSTAWSQVGAAFDSTYNGWKNPASLSFTTVFGSVLPGSLSVTLPRTDPNAVPKISKLTLRLTLDRPRSSPGYVSNFNTGLTFGGGAIDTSEVTGTGTGEQNTVQIIIGGTPAFSGFLVYQLDAWGEDSNGNLVGTRLRSTITLRIFDTPAAFFHTSYLGHKLNSVFASDDGSGRDAQAWIGGSVTINAATVNQPIATAFASGGSWFNAKGSALVVGDLVRVTNATDFTGGELAAAKGSAPASNDRFRVINTNPPAVIFDGTGQAVITHIVDSLVRTPIEITQSGLTGTSILKVVGVTRDSASGKWESIIATAGSNTATLTDNDANWPTNYWQGVRIQPNVGNPRVFTVLSNTANTITIQTPNNGEVFAVFDSNNDNTISATETAVNYVTFGRQQNSATPSTDAWEAVLDDIAGDRTILFDDTAPFTEDNAHFDFSLLPIQTDSNGREYPVLSNFNARAITGTVDTTINTTTVTGTNTRFMLELQVGDILAIGSTVRKVAVIASNTSLTLDGAAITTQTGVRAAKFQTRMLRGTVSVNVGSTTLTGTNTLFNSEGLSVGDPIIINGELHRINAIGSDTSITLTSNHVNGATGVIALLPVARNAGTIASGAGTPTFTLNAGHSLSTGDTVIIGQEVHTITVTGNNIDVSPNHVAVEPANVKVYRLGKTYTVNGRLSQLPAPNPAAGNTYVVGGRKPATVVALVDTDGTVDNGGESVLISLDADKDTATWTAATFSPALNNNGANDHILDIYVDKNKSASLQGFEFVALVADINNNAARSLRTLKLSSTQAGSLQFSGTSFFTNSDLASNMNLVVYEGQWTTVTSGANSVLEDQAQQWVDDELNNYFLMPDVSQSALMVQISDTFAQQGAQRARVQINGFNASTNNVAVGDFYRVIGLPKFSGVQVRAVGVSPMTFEPLTSATGIQNGWLMVKYDNGRHQLYRTVSDRNAQGVATTWSNYWSPVQGAFLLSNHDINDFKYIKAGGTRSADIWLMGLDEALPTIFEFVPAGDPFKGALNRHAQFPGQATGAGTGAVNALAPVPGAPQTIFIAADGSNFYRDDSTGTEVYSQIVNQFPPEFAAGVDFIDVSFASNSYGLVIASSNRYCRFGGRDENIRPDVFVQDIRSPNPGTAVSVPLKAFGHPPITFSSTSDIRDPQNPQNRYAATGNYPGLDSTRTNSGADWYGGTGFKGLDGTTGVGSLSGSNLQWTADWDPFIFDNEPYKRQLNPPAATAWIGNLYAPRLRIGGTGATFTQAGLTLTRSGGSACDQFVQGGDYIEIDRVVYRVAAAGVTANTITLDLAAAADVHAGIPTNSPVFRVAPWRLGQVNPIAARNVTVDNTGANGVCTLTIGAGSFAQEVSVGDVVEIPLKGSSPLKSALFRVTNVAATVLTLDRACPTPSGVSVPFTLLAASNEFAVSHGHAPVWGLRLSVATHGSGPTPFNTKDFVNTGSDNTSSDSVFLLDPRGVQRADFSGTWRIPRGWAIESGSTNYPNGQRVGWVHSSQSPPVVTDVDTEIAADGRKRRRAPLIGASAGDGYLIVDSDAFFTGQNGDLGAIDTSIYSPVIDASVGNDSSATISFRFRNYHLGQDLTVEARRWLVIVDTSNVPTAQRWSDWVVLRRLNFTALDWVDTDTDARVGGQIRVNFDAIQDFAGNNTRIWEIFDTGALENPTRVNHLRDSKYVQFRIRFAESTWAGWTLLDDIVVDPN